MSPFCCISFFKCSTLRPSITRHWQSNRAQSDYKHLLTFRVRAMLSQQCNLCTTRVSRYQKKHSPTHHPDCTFSNHYLLDFNGAGEDNRGRYTDNPAGRHPLRTNQWATSIIPPFLRWMPFLPQPSQFVLAWDRHMNMLDCIPHGFVIQ